MNKTRKLPQKKDQRNRRRQRNQRLKIVGVLLIAVFGLGTVAGPWRETLGVKRLRAFFFTPPPPTIPSANNPSKEYIYAGGKLVATEAPVALAAPANMSATTLSDPPSPQVSISWTATDGADHYQVERTPNIGTSYSAINSNVVGTTFTDTTVTSVNAYLYRVRAVDAVGNVSPYSNIDLATAISFTDNALQAGVTTIKAAHVTELREAINAARVAVGLSPFSWAETINSGVLIKASHIQEMRTKLDDARNVIPLSACSYTDASAGVLIQKAHVEELRLCVK
jgi:hypothetical protein